MVAIVVGGLLLQATPAEAYVLSGSGKQGATRTGVVLCKFGVFGTYSTLTLRAFPPDVSGAPSRRGREWVRYRAYLVNPSEQVVASTNWSGWLRARDAIWQTWSGTTQLSGDWRGNYWLDYRIEWWNNTRRIGLRDLRLDSYYYYNEHNEGPAGPFTSCLRQPI